jgi:septal ring factor EnvC (AmiA/AmiB activator)
MKTAVIFAMLCLMLPALLFAQQEMTYEEWEAAIVDAQKREQVAREAVSQEQTLIETVNKEIASVDTQISAISVDLEK